MSHSVFVLFNHASGEAIGYLTLESEAIKYLETHEDTFYIEVVSIK